MVTAQGRSAAVKFLKVILGPIIAKPFAGGVPQGATRVYLLHPQPGADRISQPHSPGSIEHIIVTQGRALVGLLDDAEELGAGDYICYPADQPHIFKALEPDTYALLVAEQN